MAEALAVRRRARARRRGGRAPAARRRASFRRATSLALLTQRPQLRELFFTLSDAVIFEPKTPALRGLAAAEPLDPLGLDGSGLATALKAIQTPEGGLGALGREQVLALIDWASGIEIGPPDLDVASPSVPMTHEIVRFVLFIKLEEERKALGGKVFDILGQTFVEEPLRDMLIKAIRYGDQPEVRAKLYEKVEGALDHKHLQDIIDRNALTADVFSQERLYLVKEAMEKAEAKKLQPFYLRRFVVEGLERYGGELKERERERYEIKHVPRGRASRSISAWASAP